MTYGYKDICEKPFRKISERTVVYTKKGCTTIQVLSRVGHFHLHFISKCWKLVFRIRNINPSLVT